MLENVSASTAVPRMIRSFVTIFVCVWGSVAVFARGAEEASRAVRTDSSAVEIRTPAPQSLAKFYSDADFWYDREPPPALNLWQSFKFWLLRRLTELFSSRAGRTFWRVFPYLFVAGIMVFVLLQLLKAELGTVFYRSAAPAGETEAPSEELRDADLEALLAEAISQEQHRLALRYLFLKTLQQLAAQKQIVWKPEKTNREYLLELQNTPLYEKFREPVAWFEHAWYGGFPINAAAFARAQNAFHEFARGNAP